MECLISRRFHIKINLKLLSVQDPVVFVGFEFPLHPKGKYYTCREDKLFSSGIVTE